MLPVNERIMLYRYIGEMGKRGVSELHALEHFIEDTPLNGKKKKELQEALFLLKKSSKNTKKHKKSQKNVFLDVFYRKKMILPEEYIVLKENPMNFTKIAQKIKKNELFRKKIRSILLYPSILLLEFIALVGFSLLWLVPQMHSLFQPLSTPTPFIIQILYTIYTGIVWFFSPEHLYWLILAVGLLFVIFQLLTLPPVKIYIDTVLTRFSLYKTIILASVFSSIALQNQEPHQSLKIAARNTANLKYKFTLLALSNHLKKGGTFEGFYKKRKYRTLFPSVVRRSLILAEKNNTLLREFKLLSKTLTQDLDRELKSFITILEPMLIIIIALFVGSLALTLQQVFHQIQNSVLVA